MRVPTVGKSLNSKEPATKEKEQRNISDILEAQKYGSVKLLLFTQISYSCINIPNQGTIRLHENESMGGARAFPRNRGNHLFRGEEFSPLVRDQRLNS